MSTENNFRKSTENLDEAAGGAPSDEFLDKVDPADFGTTDELADESEDDEDDETGDSTAEGDEDSDESDDASDGPESDDEESRG